MGWINKLCVLPASFYRCFLGLRFLGPIFLRDRHRDLGKATHPFFSTKPTGRKQGVGLAYIRHPKSLY